MVKIRVNNAEVAEFQCENYQQIVELITKITPLSSDEFYLLQNGKRLSPENLNVQNDVHCILKLCGGKGGFGSMLRAIGAQIEKTTNREACRDLSGRRLRDINEEKRLKAWLDKQGEREREAEERKKRKIEKLLAVPKHEFKDAEYEATRSKLTEKVSDAVEEGFKKSQAAKKIIEDDSKPGSSGQTLKRKAASTSSAAAALKAKKQKKAALWIGDDISDAESSSSSSDDDDGKATKSAGAVKALKDDKVEKEA